jgi:hypothetical protein
MPKRIYNGPHPEVDVVLPDGTVRVERGNAIEVSTEVAKNLDEQGDAWLAEAPKAPGKGAKEEGQS